MAAQAQASSGAPGRRLFWLRKLQSLTGVVPVGVFLVLHLFTNYFSSKGGASFAEKADDIAKLPFLLAVEICVVWLPILFHAFVGLMMMQNTHWSTMSGISRGSNWAYFLQRITGIIAFAFIAVHFYQIRLQKTGTNWLGANLFNETKVILTSPGLAGAFWTTIYAVGTLAAIYHFSNGIRTFCMAWGITIGERARKGATALSVAVFAVLTYFAGSSLVGFWTNPCHLPDPQYYQTNLAKEVGLTEASFREDSFKKCRQIDPRSPTLIRPASAAR